jgi:hypothetical protein
VKAVVTAFLDEPAPPEKCISVTLDLNSENVTKKPVDTSDKDGCREKSVSLL